MDLEVIMLNEKSQRKRNNILFHLHVESNEPNKWTNKIKTGSDTENKLRVAMWKGYWGLGKKGEGLEKYKLVVKK